MENITFFDDSFCGSFKEYLQEAIQVKKVDYGTNTKLNDKRIDTPYSDTFVTGFIIKGNEYIVISRNRELIFSKLLNSNIKAPQLADELTMDRNVFTVFGSVVYIALEFMNRLNISYVYFGGLTAKHQRVYECAFNNKNIQDAAKKVGVILDKNTHGNKFYFRKQKSNI